MENKKRRKKKKKTPGDSLVFDQVLFKTNAKLVTAAIGLFVSSASSDKMSRYNILQSILCVSVLRHNVHKTSIFTQYSYNILKNTKETLLTKTSQRLYS